jgi:hypothetical protein
MNRLFPGDILDLIVMPTGASVFVEMGSCQGARRRAAAVQARVHQGERSRQFPPRRPPRHERRRAAGLLQKGFAKPRAGAPIRFNFVGTSIVLLLKD